jgi:hypothetical protein
METCILGDLDSRQGTLGSKNSSQKLSGSNPIGHARDEELRRRIMDERTQNHDPL